MLGPVAAFVRESAQSSVCAVSDLPSSLDDNMEQVNELDGVLHILVGQAVARGSRMAELDLPNAEKGDLP